MQSTIAQAVGSRTEVNGLPPDPRVGKYLIFQLGCEEFGTSVLTVREIMRLQEITAVPQTPAFVKGVINLRGRVIPVIDLRMKFGLSDQGYTDHTCIIVVRTQSAEGELPMGIVVDGVVEVLTLTSSDIEDTPDFGQGSETTYLLGMAKIKGKVKEFLGEMSAFREIEGPHALVHQTARAIRTALQAGHHEEALKQGARISWMEQDLLSKLDAMEVAVSQKEA